MGSDQIAQAAPTATVTTASPLTSIFRANAFGSHKSAATRVNISFQPTLEDETTDHMATTGFLPTPAPFRSNLSAQSTSPLAMSGHKLENGVAPRPIGTPSAVTQILMRRLPADTSEQSLRLMFVWSKELTDLRLLPAEQGVENGMRSALLTFSSHGGALDAQEKLNGRAVGINSNDTVILEIVPKPAARQRSADDSPPNEPTSTSSSNASSTSDSRQASRVSGRLHSVDGIAPPMGISFGTHDLSNSEISPQFQSTFNRQPPIGSQRTERNGISSKALINGDSTADAETNELIWNPMAFAQDGSFPEPRINSQRRATAPHISPAAMAALSLNTNAHALQPASLPQFPSVSSAHPSVVSPHSTGPSPMAYPNMNHHLVRGMTGIPGMPAANPADQNPPCNTLYVGNLPLDTSEEELKATFSKQRGYKRLCFRTKANGPMCFVEFEDTSFATKALNELYGHMLHNSTKGGIRLSFSKNPLGVRSGHNNHQNNSSHMNGGHINHMPQGPNNHFSSANGPPPGLSAPPGLSSARQPYHQPNLGHNGFQHLSSGRQNGWNRGHSIDNHPSSQNGFPSTNGFVPPHMMGR